jgi:pantetheine-phosphate adenylyltransferase
VLPDDPRLSVTTFRGLVVDFCRAQRIGAVLRGVRTVSDFEYEYQMALTNRHLAPGIETVFVMPSVQYSYVSSSLIREIVRNGGDVSSFLPPPVERRLHERLRPTHPAK